MAPIRAPVAHNDNVSGGEVGYGLSVCDETLSEFSPINRIPGSSGLPVVDVSREEEVVDLRKAGLHREAAQISLALPRVAVSTNGVIVFLDHKSDGKMFVRRSADQDHPFDFVQFDWHLAQLEAPAFVTTSPDGEYLVLQDAKKIRLRIVETRTGREIFKQTSFGREPNGVHAHFNPKGGTVVIQRDGFIEILALGAKVSFLKGVSFTHAMKDEDVELPSSRSAKLDFETRGEIHALSSLDRVIQFYQSEPLLIAALGKQGTYSHEFFDTPPRTHYVPSEVPAHLEGFDYTSFRFLDRPNQTGKGFISPRETFAAEYRYQYHETHRESFLDVFEISGRRHLKTIGVYGSITTVAFSQNERYLALVTTKNALRIYDLKAEHSRAWLAIDRLPLTERPDLLAFTETGDIVVGSTAGAKLLRYPRPD